MHPGWSDSHLTLRGTRITCCSRKIRPSFRRARCKKTLRLFSAIAEKPITPRRLECQPCFRLVALATGQAVLPLTAIQLRVYVERLTALLAAGADTNATQWEYPYFTAMHAAINELEDAASSRC